MSWLVFTNLYVGFCGAALTYATYPLIGQPPRLNAVVAIVFCATLLIYNLDRLAERSTGGSAHARWVDEHRPVLWALTLLAGLGCVAWAPQLTGPARWSLLLPAGISLGYCLPCWRWHGRWRRLKQLPTAKLLLIALVWTYATALLPLINASALALELQRKGLVGKKKASKPFKAK